MVGNRSLIGYVRVARNSGAGITDVIDTNSAIIRPVPGEGIQPDHRTVEVPDIQRVAADGG